MYDCTALARVAYAQDSIKLGDFGLAVEAGGARRGSASGPAAAGAKGTVTEVVGTPFYRSPEQETPGVEYDHKADMFAMGVIFYEMWRPFSTLMERATVLGELRRTGRMPEPPGFVLPPASMAAVRNIIEWLLAAVPERRPSARQLLKSGLVPVQVEDEQLELALQAAAEPRSLFHQRLLHVLFALPPDPLIDHTFHSQQLLAAEGALGAGWGWGALSQDAVARRVSMQVAEALSGVFRMHGAIQMDTPLVSPCSRAVRWGEEQAATFLAPNGVRVQLPFSLTVPFARHVALVLDARAAAAARNGESSAVGLRLRRYDIGRVLRRGNVGGPPRAVAEAVFDVVWTADTSPSAAGDETREVGPPAADDTVRYEDEQASFFAAETLVAMKEVRVRVARP